VILLHQAGGILCFWLSLCRGAHFGQFVLARSVEIGVTHTCDRGVSQTYGIGVSHTCFGGVFGWSFCTIGGAAGNCCSFSSLLERNHCMG